MKCPACKSRRIASVYYQDATWNLCLNCNCYFGDVLFNGRRFPENKVAEQAQKGQVKE